MAKTLQRALEERLRPSTNAPVLILEGARGIGKTTLARQLQASGAYATYVSLSDDSSREFASSDPQGWLADLQTPAIVDEAQLVPELPQYIKAAVDEPSQARRYLLTGSAAIGRRGLGGADPLTARSVRFRLDPFTSAELAGRPESTSTLVDKLFAGPTRRAESGGLTVAELRERLDTGGLPIIALGQVPPEARSDFRDSLIASTLTDDVLPGERFDALSARSVLDAFLANPGGILNLASLGDRLGIDPRTLSRYLDVLERRFLLYHLPNLALNEHRQGRARAKIHPLDPGLSADRLQETGRGIETSHESLGRVFESYAVAQIVAAAGATSQRIRCFYWRDSKSELEVDLAITDGTGRTVGVEVKASANVSPKDFRGLRALAAARGLTAGYVIYTGKAVFPIGDNLWALPVGALDGDEIW